MHAVAIARHLAQQGHDPIRHSCLSQLLSSAVYQQLHDIREEVEIPPRIGQEAAEIVENSGMEPSVMGPMDPVAEVGAGKVSFRPRREIYRNFVLCDS